MKNEFESHRECGSSLLVFLIPLSFLLALSAALSFLTVANSKAMSASTNGMRAFYVADSGAQAANALVRSTGTSMQPTTLEETLNGGTAIIDIEAVSTELFKITSHGTYDGDEATVEIHVAFESQNFLLQSGVEVNIGRNVHFGSDFQVRLDSNALISGFDHDANGNALADQSNAVPGLAMHEAPGNETLVTLLSNAVIEGSPTGVSRDTDTQATALSDIRDHARDNADIFISGSRTLTDAHNGSYGTATDPVLVKVRLGEESTLRLDSNFEGYGTLVIDISEVEEGTPVQMLSNAKWHGLVIVRLSGEAELEGSSLVRMDSNSAIIGGLGVLLDGTPEDGGQFIDMHNDSKILYSTELISSAPGTEVASGDNSANVVSFRTL